MFSVRSPLAWFLLLAAGLCGCSGTPAAITGKVTLEGKEVTAGGVVLTPIAAEGDKFPGNPGQADVRPDGTYSMAIAPGPHGLAQRFTVRFTPPVPQLTAATAKDAVVPYAGMVPKQAEVEIRPGSNVINIELIPAPDK